MTFRSSASAIIRRYVVVKLLARERQAELLATLLHRVPSGVLAQHKRRAGHADVFRAHDFVRPAILQHPVLMDPRLVGERVAADDGLVGLNVFAGQLAQQLAGGEQLLRIDADVDWHAVRRAPC